MTRPAPPALPALHDLHLEYPRPQFSGDEQPVARVIVRDAVQHVGRSTLRARQQAANVYPPEHMTRVGRDPDNRVGLPDVRVNLTSDVLHLVQTGDRDATV